MKRIICLITALCLIFGSFSFAFAATQDVSDAQTHTILGNLYNLLNGSDFKGRLNNIFNKLTDINANIVTLMGWLDPSTGGSTPALLNQILNALVYSDAAGNVKSWLADIWQTNAVYLPDLDALKISLTNPYQDVAFPNLTALKQNSHRNFVNLDGSYNVWFLQDDGTLQSSTYNWNLGTPIGNTALLLNKHMQNLTALGQGLIVNNKSSQTYTDWTDLSSDTFTPTSTTNGIYTWLQKLQTPAARLAYVLASDERIAAQEAAAANEEAVVDNFIDSTGDGSASPSDIGSISDLSSGYKSNFGSDASVSGIFNIFNSNNMGWFSQETANQLDTTTPTRRGSTFETPLLDQQIEDIYDQIGVKHD